MCLKSLLLTYYVCQVSSLDSDDGEDGKQMPSESDTEEFPSFPVTPNKFNNIHLLSPARNFNSRCYKTEKDTGESSASKSNNKL